MGRLQQPDTTLSEGDHLRDLIHDCERGLASLRTGADATLVLEGCHAARQLAASLAAEDLDVRAENGRLDTISARLAANAGRIVRMCGGRERFGALRDSAGGKADEPPWNLDALARANDLRRLRTFGFVMLALALLAGVGYLFRGTLFPPDPVGDAVNVAERALRDGRTADAPAAIEAGLVITPANESLLIWRGVLAERAGDAAKAASAFDAARAAANPPAFLFLVDRAQIYLRVGQAEQALNDLNAALVGNGERAELYYLRSIAYELKGDRGAAMEDLNRCASLAETQGNDVLLATARLRIGLMMGGS